MKHTSIRLVVLPATLTVALLTVASIESANADGILVGDSTFFDTLDYSDTFTGTDAGGRPDRPYIAAVQPAAAYVVENTYGKPSISFQIGSGFSFAGDNDPGAQGFVDGVPAYPLAAAPNASNAGSDFGFTQTGGAVDYAIAYGIRDEYWVQVDAVQTPDRIDLSSGAGVGIFAGNSLSVFFRGDGSGNASLFNGATDTPIQGENPAFNTGITGAGEWHNYAARYDMLDKEIELYVDGVSVGVIDLTTFAGGLYQDWSNVFVGAGGSGGNRVWTDNFQIGGNGPSEMPDEPLPDPGNLPDLPASLVSFWDFDEAAGPVEGFLQNFAYDRQADRDGSIVGTVLRVPGLIGLGAAQFNDTNGDGVNVGSEGYAFTSGMTIEAFATTSWDGSDQAELFRKEDGGNRLLFSFQAGGNINDAFGQLVGTLNTPGISFGINVNGAYGELDIAFDGLEGRPDLATVADGEPHHFVATFDSATGDKSVFFDGALIGRVNLGAGATMTSGGGAPALIGASGGGEPYVGVMDEVAIYDAALTDAEVGQHFANVQVGQNYFSSTGFEFKVTGLSYDPNTGATSLTWTSIPGRLYRVVGSGGLGDAWFELEDGLLATDTETTQDLNLSTFFPDELPPKFFFRIEESQP